MAEEICVETKGLLFDMDGVLISSIGSVERCWKRWCIRYGVPDAENYRGSAWHARGRRDADAEAGVGRSPGGGRAARRSRTWRIVDTGDLTVLPGAKALLERCRRSAGRL